MVKNCDDMLSRFHLIPGRNGQTDGRTYRQTDICYINIARHAASVCWRAIKMLFFLFEFCYWAVQHHCKVGDVFMSHPILPIIRKYGFVLSLLFHRPYGVYGRVLNLLCVLSAIRSIDWVLSSCAFMCSMFVCVALQWLMRRNYAIAKHWLQRRWSLSCSRSAGFHTASTCQRSICWENSASSAWTCNTMTRRKLST